MAEFAGFAQIRYHAWLAFYHRIAHQPSICYFEAVRWLRWLLPAAIVRSAQFSKFPTRVQQENSGVVYAKPFANQVNRHREYIIQAADACGHPSNFRRSLQLKCAAFQCCGPFQYALFQRGSLHH